MMLGILKQYTPGRPNLIQYIRYKVADLCKFISLLTKGHKIWHSTRGPPGHLQTHLTILQETLGVHAQVLNLIFPAKQQSYTLI